MKSNTGFIALSLLLLGSAIVYWPSLAGMPIWEDHTLIAGPSPVGNQLTQSMSTPFLGAYFRPLVSASFQIDRALHGPTPLFYHSTNILLHLLTIGILIGFLWSAFRDRRIAIVGGLAFAVQPAQVGAVAWIGGRTDSLCALWISLFAWCLVVAVRNKGHLRTFMLLASSGAYLAALFTKEQSLALLPLVPLAYKCFSSDECYRRGWRNIAKGTAPFMAATLLFIVACAVFAPETRLSHLHVLGIDFGLIGRTALYYSLLLLAPTQKWMHTFSLVSFEGIEIWAAVGGWGIISVACLGFLRLLRSAPAAAWCMALAILALLPVCNLLQMPSLIVAPYRAGIAGLGLAGLIAWTLVTGFDFWANRAESWCARTNLGRAGFVVAGAAYCVWCLGLTTWGARQWQDEVSLDTKCAQFDRGALFVYTNLGIALNKSGDAKRAVSLMERELTWLFDGGAWQDEQSALISFREDRRIIERVQPSLDSESAAAVTVSRLYTDLGTARLNANDAVAARNAFKLATAFDASNAVANLGLGICAYRAGDLKHATSRLRIAAALDSTETEAHSLLGKIYMEQSLWPRAKAEFQQVVSQRSWLGASYTDLADSQIKLGDFRGARDSLRLALQSAVCDKLYIQSRLASLEVSQ